MSLSEMNCPPGWDDEDGYKEWLDSKDAWRWGACWERGDGLVQCEVSDNGATRNPFLNVDGTGDVAVSSLEMAMVASAGLCDLLPSFAGHCCVFIVGFEPPKLNAAGGDIT